MFQQKNEDFYYGAGKGLYGHPSFSAFGGEILYIFEKACFRNAKIPPNHLTNPTVNSKFSTSVTLQIRSPKVTKI